jgi:hypothetical protein
MDNTPNMLRAISTLRRRDGLSGDDESDILTWLEIAGEDYNTERLSEKTVERIRVIFHKHYV